MLVKQACKMIQVLSVFVIGCDPCLRIRPRILFYGNTSTGGVVTLYLLEKPYQYAKLYFILLQ